MKKSPVAILITAAILVIACILIVPQLISIVASPVFMLFIIIIVIVLGMLIYRVLRRVMN